MKGLKDPLVRSRVTSRKFMVFLFASMVILRPFDLKISLTSCFVFSICLGVVLHLVSSGELLNSADLTVTLTTNAIYAFLKNL